MHTYAVSFSRYAFSEARTFSKPLGRSSITFRGFAMYGTAARMNWPTTTVAFHRRPG